MAWVILIIGAMLLIAFANGANDNFKGVATLFGSGTTQYRKALIWATLCTLVGSILACCFAGKLISTFGGKGLIPDELVQQPAFLFAVIAGAGLTVLSAARFGIPISTTHSLTGALAGSGLAAIGTDLAFSTLFKKFFIPLLVSPFLAVALTLGLYLSFQFIRRISNLKKTTCVCVGARMIPTHSLMAAPGQIIPVSELKRYDVFMDKGEECEAKAIHVYDGNFLGISVQKILDFFHFLSAGAVSFARGLNDTPKIVALSVMLGALSLHTNIGLVGITMALGGWFAARRVAETMSNKITPMTHGQGFSANLVTSFLVIFASKLGVPVSTTHVSCGSIFGIGLASQQGRWDVIGGILSAWVLTLPIAGLSAALLYWVFRGAVP